MPPVPLAGEVSSLECAARSTVVPGAKTELEPAPLVGSVVSSRTRMVRAWNASITLMSSLACGGGRAWGGGRLYMWRFRSFHRPLCCRRCNELKG